MPRRNSESNEVVVIVDAERVFIDSKKEMIVNYLESILGYGCNGPDEISFVETGDKIHITLRIPNAY